MRVSGLLDLLPACCISSILASFSQTLFGLCQDCCRSAAPPASHEFNQNQTNHIFLIKNVASWTPMNSESLKRH